MTVKRAAQLATLGLGLVIFTSAALADAMAAQQPVTPAWAARHFKDSCSSCHGADGADPLALPGNPPPIIASQ